MGATVGSTGNAAGRSFAHTLGAPLTKRPITVLQINLGRRCNLACTHCHVEAGPKRAEELSPEVCAQLIELIRRFPQIQTVDLTGGAPEMNYGFRPIAEAARAAGQETIVRSNLTVYFEPGYEDVPEYCARWGLHVVASLPCYLEDTVDRMRGKGVYEASMRALQRLNALGYGRDRGLQLDLVYNPALPASIEQFGLTPNQQALETAYKEYLRSQFGIDFNRLIAITNLPIGRTKHHLQRLGLQDAYAEFLRAHHNPATVAGLMCRNQLSVDYRGRIYDCDFNQMEGLAARTADGRPLTVGMLLEANTLDRQAEVQTGGWCFGCTAGSGSSCGGALVP